MNKVVKDVFLIVGGVLLAMILFQLFFGKENSVIAFASRSVEKPIAAYYYNYSYYPSVHITDGVSNSLGVYSNNITNLQLEDTDNASSVANYSTGWY